MLEAGRELDLLVAEKVMGWTKTIARTTDDEFEVWAGVDWAVEDFCPSTDIASAWEVVEKIGNDSEPSIHGIKGGTWICVFYSASEVEVEANTVPHAICLAALLAKGIDVVS